MANERMHKIDELIKNNISVVLQRLFPDEIISVTQTHVSKDLSFAKIWISSIKDIDKNVRICQNHAREIQYELSQKLTIRKIPKLYFVADKTEEKAQKIDDLLNQL